MSPFRYLLEPFALLYGWVICLRNFLYDRSILPIYPSPIPTLSVGNISVGGTGKTPTAEYILAYYHTKGIKVGYLSRGYGRKTKGYLLVNPEKGSSTLFGDEALQVANKFPHLPIAVCEDRKVGIQRLVEEEEVDLVILDDAFQHRRVSRHVDLALIDANRLPTEDRLLPAGRLREPIRALRRTHMVIVNKLMNPQILPELERLLSPYQPNLAFSQPSFSSIHSFFPSISPPSSMNELEVILFSGIGNNQYFQHQVEDAGSQVRSTYFFRDHQTYTLEDLKKIADEQREFSQNSPNLKPIWILTTEKDYFRLRGESWLSQFQDIPLGYLPIKIDWLKGEERVHRLLDSLLSH